MRLRSIGVGLGVSAWCAVGAEASAQECSGWVRASAVADALAAAKLDPPEAYVAQVDAAERVLVCVKQKLDRAGAAQVHAAIGLRAWLVGDDARAELAFRAARAAAPEVGPPAGVDTPELLALWEKSVPPVVDASSPEGQTSPADLQAVLAVLDVNGSFLYDGHQGRRPAERAALVQVLDEAGAVRHTAWLRPEDALPTHETPAPTVAISQVLEGRRLAPPGTTTDLLAGAEPDPELPADFVLPVAPGPVTERAPRWGLVPLGAGVVTFAAGTTMLALNHQETLGAWEAAGQAETWPDYVAAEADYEAGVAAVPLWRGVAGAGLALAGAGVVVTLVDARIAPMWVGGPGVMLQVGGGR